MADNRDLSALSGNVAADEVTYSGDTAVVQLAKIVGTSGAEGSKTVVEVVGSAGSSAAGVLSVQGIASGVAVPVSDNSGSLTVDTAVTSASHVVAAATANPTVVKASAGTLRGFSVFNVAAYPVYLKFHNTASTPTAGSGVVRTFGIQSGVNISFTLPGGGLSFSTGIGITLVKDLADAGTTAVAAGDAVVEVFYD